MSPARQHWQNNGGLLEKRRALYWCHQSVVWRLLSLIDRQRGSFVEQGLKVICHFMFDSISVMICSCALHCSDPRFPICFSSFCEKNNVKIRGSLSYNAVKSVCQQNFFSNGVQRKTSSLNNTKLSLFPKVQSTIHFDYMMHALLL